MKDAEREFASNIAERQFQVLNRRTGPDRLAELEAKVDVLEKRVEELASRLGWLLECCP